jgi:hypothetical protein
VNGQLTLGLFDSPEPAGRPPTLDSVPIIRRARAACDLIRTNDPPVSERWDLLGAVCGFREDETPR